MVRWLLFVIIFLILNNLSAQSLRISKIEPPNWWAGMQRNHVQLMLYGEYLSDFEADFNREGIKVEKIHYLQNHSYSFIDINIASDIKPGTYILRLKSKKKVQNIDFPVLKRQDSAGRFQGFSPSDIVYLITPDRFVNGDVGNDHIDGMRDTCSSENILGRHGGDIQGIINKLGYLNNLGVTALWINPLLLNDERKSYHGYAATDFYRIDPRFGSNELYKELVEKAHDLNIKIIMDHVSNHVGVYHPWIDNLPTNDWLNGSINNHLYNTHRKEVLYDIHADRTEKEKVQRGWFVDEMPDLNQENPYLKNYLIQNTLWWIEETGIDGIREDTYPYSDPGYLSQWLHNIFTEYPGFNVVGEIWIHDPVFLAPYQKESRLIQNYHPLLPSITDFGLFEAFGRVFNRNQSIDELYTFISRDFLYPDPHGLLTFLDNHDVMRLHDLVDGNTQKYKMALKILLTMRGIPQIYYGTEIGLAGGPDHGQIRADFPGGFPGDSPSAFDKIGRNQKENEIFDFLSNIISIRRKYIALQKGSLVHLPPANEIYTYFREFDGQKMLMIANNNDHPKDISLQTLSNQIADSKYLLDVENHEKLDSADDVVVLVPAYDLRIFELIKDQ